MRLLLFAAALAACSFTACKKESHHPKGLQGVYTGEFYRAANGHENKSAVTLTFKLKNWTGEGQYPKYPALCKGTFTTKGNKAYFSNECIWTTEFDGSLILSGEWDVRYYGDSVQMTRDGGTYKDIYLLKKK